MKRKLLLILSLCIVAVCSALIFTACQVDGNNSGNSGEISNDDNQGSGGNGETDCVHEYISLITQPTCTEQGFTKYTCLKCNDTYVDNYVDSLGHDYLNHEAEAATCTEIGWNEYQTCSRCDYSTYKVIPAGHDLQYHKAQSATCTEVGWNAYETCSRCDYSTYKEISALGHNYQSHEAKEATCTEIGWEAYETCSRCNYTTYQEISALMAHDYTDGYCKRCNEQEPTLDYLTFTLKKDNSYEVNNF